MGTLTLDNMKTEIRAAFGDRTDYDDRLTLLMNLAQVRLARRHDFEELKSRRSFSALLTADISADMTVALPTSPKVRELYSIIVMDGTSSVKLIGRPGQTFDKEIPRPEAFARGRPSQYRRMGDSIDLWRIPDKTYTLRLHSSNWPVDLSTGSDTSDLDEKDDLIILLVCVWLSMTQDRPDRTNYFWSVFRTMYQEALGEDTRRPDDRAGGSGLEAPGDYWNNPFFRGSP